MKIAILCLFMIVVAHKHSQSQDVKELKLSLDEEGNRYLKLTFLNQVWLRFNESNPGTTVLGESAANTFDIGLRRTRIQFFGQLTDHVFFYTQFGQNNFNFLSQNAGNRKLQAFFHDALGEFKVWKDRDVLKFGAGLTIANGLSRFSQPSVSSIMSLDVPVFAQATVDQTDEFSRKLSVYARGQLGKLDYRVVLSDPFPITTNGQGKPVVGPHATFATIGHHKQYQAFLAYNFFDKEPHTTPYMTGTYLGKKSVFNLEAGIIHQRNATETGSTDPVSGIVSNRTFYDMKLWSVALFYDVPLKQTGSALSLYAGYFDLDYGKGYLRFNGIMNPADGIIGGAPGSQGNSFPMFGTGNVTYLQAGYLFGKQLLGEGGGMVMPYGTLMLADYERLNNSMAVWSFGLNYFIDEHRSKISLDLQSRPTFGLGDGGSLSSESRKMQVTLQYQIFI